MLGVLGQSTDIHVGKGEYDPGTPKGFQLPAHEVAHAVGHPVPTSRDGADVAYAKLRFAAFGKTPMQRLLSEVLIKRQMGKQLDKMMGGRR
jgi:hypothetical protein